MELVNKAKLLPPDFSLPVDTGFADLLAVQFD